MKIFSIMWMGWERRVLRCLDVSYNNPFIRHAFLKIKNHRTGNFICIFPSRFSSPSTYTWCDHCTFLLCKTFRLYILLDFCLCYFLNGKFLSLLLIIIISKQIPLMLLQVRLIGRKLMLDQSLWAM